MNTPGSERELADVTHVRRAFAGAAAVAAAAVAAVALAVVWGGGPPAAAGPASAVSADPAEDILDAYAGLPLAFVENRGQADPRVRYAAQGAGYAFAFTAEEVVLSLSGAPAAPGVVTAAAGGGPASEGVALALRFVDANARVAVEGEDRAPGTVSYLRGDDPAGWHSDLPAYTGVVYRELWPGIDLALRGEDGRLKYELRVQPGADPADIRLAYAGADGLTLDDDGGLLLDTPPGALRDAPPVSWQEIDGARVAVDSRYVLHGDAEYGFAVGAHDPDHALVIDPGLDYSTFLGGSTNETAAGVAVDADGNAYIVGTTQSDDLPVTAGAFDTTFNGGVVDVFVAKLNADASALEYATYLGGTPTPLRRGSGDPFEFGRDIAVDADGHAYVTGQTTSDDFPTTAGAFQTDINITENPDDATDGFVAKLTPSGSGLVYSTYLGGTNFDDTDGIALDAAGNAYVTGRTSSSDFPVTPGAFQTERGGGFDGFVTKLNADGSDVVSSTYLGGADNEVTEDVVVDADGNAYVAGSSRSEDFPTTAGAFQPTHPGGAFEDLFTAFAVKLEADGSGLVYSTFLGGTKRDFAGDVAVDADGHAYVSGATQSPEFPTTAGAYDPAFDGTSEAFVTKLAVDGSGLVWSTFLNGGVGGTIALDADRNAWLAGGTSRTDAPTTEDAFARENSGAGDVWLGQLSADGAALLYGTYFGGANSDSASAIALDAAGAAYLTGTTRSLDFPTTVGAFQTTLASTDPSIWGDAFVAKFGAGVGELNPPPPPPTRTDTFSGRIEGFETITHSVSVEATGTVDLHLDWDESRTDLTLQARDPSGDVVFLDESSARPKSGTFEATVTGTYAIDVINEGRRKTEYTLSVTSPVLDGTSSAALATFGVDPTTVTGGESSTGTVTLTAAAPAEGAEVELLSSDPAVATVPSTVTVPGGMTAVSFSVTTSSVEANTSVTLTASYGGVTKEATLGVNAADGLALSTLELDPTTVAGGESSTGTVTLTGAAPPGGASVALTSSNTEVATVPDSVTVPEGSTSATFTVSTSSVTVDSSSAITASHGGESRSVILSVTAPAETDTVTIEHAEYREDKQELRIEASSSSSSATLEAYVTETDEFIGTLEDGRLRTTWDTNPENITVKSSLGGSATSPVTVT